ncbi:MAG TPA: exonuclease domain-containing protein [Burkholderiales bacterium]|nr:exonuclease domain-containing protein [Burkholderiales bacterium]
MRLLDAPLAIVDLETTGTDPAGDRITEIAVLEVQGFALTSEWSTLVNPGAGTPSPIQALTGITNEMVARAPSFAQVAEELHELLRGRVFVAHNARFDYGFLRREFDRAGIRFTAKTLCTVRLSRRLYPREPHHNLDSLIARHGIDCRQRHRAMGDADALWQFLQIAEREHGEEVVAVAARQIARQPTLPPQLERAAVDAVPEAPGVYLFYDEASVPLYIGKSASMRTRVMAHFCGASSQRSVELSKRVRRIDWKRTAGELGALLLEARLVKELAPEFNRQLRATEGLCGFAFDGRRLRFAGAHEIDGETLPFVYGVFRTKRAALQALRGLADEHRLCLQALGFETGPQHACFRHQLGRCAGVCAGRESVHLHHARLAAALASWKAADWPHSGPLGIVERGRDGEEAEMHVVDRWCYLGAARSDAEVAELLEGGRRGRFDFDHYRILARHLGKRGVRTVRLAAPCTAS